LSTKQPAPIAVSLGDPAGIGPELILAAWQMRDERGIAPFVVCGGANVLASAASELGLECPISMITEPAEAVAKFDNSIPVLGDIRAEYTPGSPSLAGAQLAFESLRQATQLALEGSASAVVTAPIAKSELAKAGFSFAGQTEYLADACGLAEHDAVMMLAGPSLRTVPLTVHCALSDVPGLLSRELICHKARIVAASLERDFGIEHPRLAVAGLNPHAGEGGKFGQEEARVIAPAIEALRSEGIDAVGPQSADAMFTPRARSQYHAALCMYHDQALIPLKALEFDEGVNVTLGLPIIRTSPDHGTAFDIAGKGIADPGAMIAAIRMAGEMAARRAEGQTLHG
jgi:4-hydroxythreonine-4-phosphate dehydrogenase